MRNNRVIYVNHIQAGISYRILISDDYIQDVYQFFSMFHVTDYDLGLKSICQFSIDHRKVIFLLSFGDEKIVFDSISECLLYVSDIIQHVSTPNFVGYYHSASCLSKNGKAILLIGATMAGKTSLNMFLCKNGFLYLSDDVSIINRELKVISMPTPVKIRRGIIYDDSFFDQYKIYENNEIKVLGSLNSKTTEAAYDIVGAVFLHRGYDMKIEDMPSCELAEELMKNYAKIISMSTQVAFTSKLAAKVKGYRLFYTSLDKELLKTIEDI